MNINKSNQLNFSNFEELRDFCEGSKSEVKNDVNIEKYFDECRELCFRSQNSKKKNDLEMQYLFSVSFVSLLLFLKEHPQFDSSSPRWKIFYEKCKQSLDELEQLKEYLIIGYRQKELEKDALSWTKMEKNVQENINTKSENLEILKLQKRFEKLTENMNLSEFTTISTDNRNLGKPGDEYNQKMDCDIVSLQAEMGIDADKKQSESSGYVNSRKLDSPENKNSENGFYYPKLNGEKKKDASIFKKNFSSVFKKLRKKI